MFESITLADIHKKHKRILRKPSSTRAVTWIIEEKGVRAVVKDFSLNRLLYRNIIGRFLIWRERKAYRRLKGLEGIPALYRTINGLALVIEEIPGKNLESIKDLKQLPAHFFMDLTALIERIHGRGLAHCDLKRAPNIILGNDGRPYIVDWSSSISEREFRFFPFHLIYRRFTRDDIDAVIKIRLKYCPECVSPEEKFQYHNRSNAERHIRALRDRARDLLKKIA